MDVTLQLTSATIVDEICGLDWDALSTGELTLAAWGYYFFSVQFRESLELALVLYPDDANLAKLASEECNTSNLSPWPDVAAIGECMNHDTFMSRTLALETPGAVQKMCMEAAGHAYLATTRGLDRTARAMAIASYEDGGLEKVFHAILRAPHWDTRLLAAFRHFLTQHIMFDSDPAEGHGALARHIQPDDRILPLWLAFRDLLVACVPALAGRG